jgi:hypothetical protein
MTKNLQESKLCLTFALEIINIVLTINNKVMDKKLETYVKERKERINKVLNKPMESSYDMECNFEAVYMAKKELEYLEAIESNGSADKVLSFFKRDLVRIEFNSSSSMVVNICRLMDENVKRRMIRDIEYL